MFKKGFLNRKKGTTKQKQKKKPKHKPNQAEVDQNCAADDESVLAQHKHPNDAQTTENLESLTRILGAIRNRQVSLQGGYLKELFIPSVFRREMYPLEADDVLRAKKLPASLDEFLHRLQTEINSKEQNGAGDKSSLSFFPHVLEAMKSIRRKADSILAGVTSKARAAGEDFNVDTANVLRPQILLEAFARALPRIVQAASRRVQQERAQAPDRRAPTNIPGLSNQHQLPAAAVEALFFSTGGKKITSTCAAGLEVEAQEASGPPAKATVPETHDKTTTGPFYAIVDDFLGRPWQQSVQFDLDRYVLYEAKSIRCPQSRVAQSTGDRARKESAANLSPAEGKTLKETVFPRIGVLPNATDLAQEYPAFCEVLDALRLLPFEINNRLQAQAASSVMAESTAATRTTPAAQPDHQIRSCLCLPSPDWATIQVYDTLQSGHNPVFDNPGLLVST